MILRDCWIWHDFFEDLKDGAIEEEVRQIAQRVGSPVLVALDAQTAGLTINRNADRYGKKLCETMYDTHAASGGLWRSLQRTSATLVLE